MKVNELLNEDATNVEADAQKYLADIRASGQHAATNNNMFFDGLTALSRGKYAFRGMTFRGADQVGFPIPADLNAEFKQLVARISAEELADKRSVGNPAKKLLPKSSDDDSEEVKALQAKMQKRFMAKEAPPFKVSPELRKYAKAILKALGA